MTRWRKRPVTVEAVRWTGDNAAELAEFTGSRFGVIDPEDRTDAPELTGQVFDVLHSTWVGMSTGQWVLKGVRGEFYPCDDAVLAETYDPAGDDDGTPCRTVTRDALAGALAALPLGEFLTPEARDRFADALLAQMPAASDARFYMEGVKAERERIAELAEEHGVSYARNIPGGEFEYWSFADLIRQEPQP